MSRRKKQEEQKDNYVTIAVAGFMFIAFLFMSLALELLAIDMTTYQLLAIAALFFGAGWFLKQRSDD
ncbi:MAG: hypothetical protein ACW99G_12635 [Candidatus Thorarchaeota archaeon]|jgi:hypothetical protein